MRRVRAGQHAKYVARAAAMADERGLTPTPEQLDGAARSLRLADLAQYRLDAWNAIQGKGGAS